MTAEKQVYEPGDVVYGADPYKGMDAARPWPVISNHEDKPFYGEQYIALSLTTRTWMEGLIEIGDGWVHGGAPDDSRIVPWAVQSIDHDDIEHWQGRLESTLVDEAVETFISYL